MKKGCIIALCVFAALIVIGSFVAFKWGIPKAQSLGSSAIVFALESAVEAYTTEYGTPPEGAVEKVVEALRGNNQREIVFLGSDVDGQVVAGKIVDVWRNPLAMTRAADGNIRFSSAGPNGEHGDADDVTSERIRGIAKNLEDKAAEIDARLKAKSKASGESSGATDTGSNTKTGPGQ